MENNSTISQDTLKYHTAQCCLNSLSRVTLICVSKLTSIGSDNGRRRAVIWTNAGILLVRTLGITFSGILSEIHAFSYSKMHWKMWSEKCGYLSRPQWVNPCGTGIFRKTRWPAWLVMLWWYQGSLSREVSKPRDLFLELSDRSEIWQALRQHCCRCACQISKRYDDLKYQSRGFETSRDLTIRRFSDIETGPRGLQQPV